MNYDNLSETPESRQISPVNVQYALNAGVCKKEIPLSMLQPFQFFAMRGGALLHRPFTLIQQRLGRQMTPLTFFPAMSAATPPIMGVIRNE